MSETIISKMYHDYSDGLWEGETPEELLARWANCEHAEVHPDGSLYVEGPQNGHYLSDDKVDEFVAWMKAEGVTFAE